MNFLIFYIVLLVFASFHTMFSQQQPLKKDTSISTKKDSFQIINKENEIEHNEFVVVDKEPEADLKQIQKNLVYPKTAQQNGIEGKVVVRVLVSKEGLPLKCFIQSSDSKLLDEEAMNVIMKSKFKPASQNNQKIHCWLSVPIIFKL